jgi:hypothetical protein
MSKMLSILIIFSFVFAQVDYEEHIQPIFNSNCTSCHIYGHASGLNLTSYAGVMAGSNVVPNDHANSELYNRITLPESNQLFMPKNGSPLLQSEIDLIAQWIDEGALETPLNAQLFVNEIDYDQPGTDADEFIEISGPAGSYSNVIVIFMNGNGNTEYNTFELGNVTLTDEADGYGFYVIGGSSIPNVDYTSGFPSSNAIQNGNPDGIELWVNEQIVDAVSYAGSMNDSQGNYMEEATPNDLDDEYWEGGEGLSIGRLGIDGSPWSVMSNSPGTVNQNQIFDPDANFLPIANAGVDQTVPLGFTVTLDGSGSSDPDGSINAYAWTQLTGISVILTGADQVLSSFTAPATEGDMSFELLVTDDGGETGRDTVNISVVEVGVSTVFISQYVEGSGHNKYLEIYNGDITAVDLETEGYTLARDNDGNMDFTYSALSDWGSLNNLATGAVIVLASVDHEIYSSPDSVLGYPSPLHFNGNDAVALLKNGVVVDIVGELGNSNDHIKNMTLTRNANIIQGNPTFTWSEWTELSTDNVNGLGEHNTNTDAPSVVITNVSPGFIADNTEIEIMSELIPVSGDIDIANIYYGTDGSLLNQAEMWFDSGNSWMGIIDPQPGNTLLQFKVVAVDNSGNEGESTVQDQLVASTTPTEIQEIHANVVEDQIVTIQGIVTIGSGFLDDDATRAYIQDESGRGLNLFDYTFIEGINRGDELRLVGYVDQYFTTVEVTNFIFETLSTENNLPAAIVTTPTSANSPDYEGTLISFEGAVTQTESISNGAGTKLTIDDITYVQIWSTTGINTAQYIVGSEWGFTGVGSQYIDDYQLLVGYEEDIATLGIAGPVAIPNEFSLHPVYPNPFNPRATIDFSLQFDGEIHLNVYDINGKIVDELENANLLAGNHRMVWNASSLPSGLYFIRLQDGENQEVQKVMLLK